MRMLLMAVKQGRFVLFCGPNRTKCILLVSAMEVQVCSAELRHGLSEPEP
jgi:hypothetical protein